MPRGASNAVAPAVELDSFGPLPMWNPNTTLLIYGKAGLGKTTLAKLLLQPALFLFVRHADKLKDFDPTLHKGGIILDDLTFIHWPRTSQIHLLDVCDDTQVHCRYACAEIPAGTKRIITTNEEPHCILFTGDAAIQRRLTVWHMEKELGAYKITEKKFD